ncbi:MAG: M12 family metallo-peptidase [Tannerella sp.]|jgi:hypothetical protein|nr:M12 family metallo-peptidase [Tannerella sp.]
MKTRKMKFSFVVLILAVSAVFGQENVLYSNIQQAKVSNVEFQTLSSVLVRESAPDDRRLLSKFNNSEEVLFFTYDASKPENAGSAISLDIPLEKGNLSLELMEVPEAFYDYEVVTSDGETYPANRNFRHYRGIVKNDSNSRVAVSFLDNEIMGLIATDEGNLVIGKENLYGKHLLYNDKNLAEKPSFECETPDDLFIPYDPNVLLGTVSATSLKYVKFYVETEYDIYQARSSIGGVESYITGVFNQVATLYAAESIPTALSTIYIWTSTDPYTATSTSALLAQFQNTRTSINGDLGILLTFRSELGGGQAAAVHNALCLNTTSQKLAVSMIESSYSTFPTYSWTVYVVTHEFGHLFGSRHTHACVWNGNNTAIDGCAGYTENPAGTAYGDCPLPGNPANGGTMMSYCHWLPSVGINFNLGFGTQPGNVIRTSYNAASCLTNVTISGPSEYPYAQFASYSSLLTGTWSVTLPLTVYSGQGTNTVVLSSPPMPYPWYATLTLLPWGSTTEITKYITIPPDSLYSPEELFPIVIYPNPANSVVNIEIQRSDPAALTAQKAKNQVYTVQVYDLEGTLRKEEQVGKEQISVPVSDLRDGIYVLHIYVPGVVKPHTVKLIIKH